MKDDPWKFWIYEFKAGFIRINSNSLTIKYNANLICRDLGKDCADFKIGLKKSTDKIDKQFYFRFSGIL